MDAKQRISEIERLGTHVKGKRELLAHLNGQKLSPGAAIRARCYECMGYYQDGYKACSDTFCALNRWQVR